MAGYDTEEERVEAIRAWWKENGGAIVFGAVLGIGLLLGWRGWIAYKDHRAEAASTLYARLLSESANDMHRAVATAQTLRTDYSATPYGALAALEAARLQGQEDTAAAEEQLRWAMERGSEAALRQLARLRLARVLVALNRSEEALTVLETDWPAAYLSLVEELRGDAWRVQGDIANARLAYGKAMLSGGRENTYVQMKLDDLGPAGSDR